MKSLLDNKYFKIIKKVLNILIVVFVLLFLFVVALQRFSNNKISFFDYRMFTVISGSMEPKYNIGDILVAKEVDSSEIKVGDAISYLGNKGDFKDKIITHEVTKIEKDENGKYSFRTKGIKYGVEDVYEVSEDQIYGVVVYKTILLSFMYKLISTPIGLLIFVVIPIVYIIVSEIISTLLEKEEERRKRN